MRRLTPTSLTTRLGLLFALLATLTFAAVGAYLYQSLATQLESREDADLLEKIGHIRHLLHETPSVKAIQDDPHRFVDAAAGHEGLILILKSADGRILMRNQPDLAALPKLPITPANQTPNNASVRAWMLSPDLPARSAAAWGTVGEHAGEQVHIVMARTNKARQAILATYLSNVLIAVLSGALLAALLGYAVVRRGLRPVRAIARQAQSITAQHLDRRLDGATAPLELQTLIASFNAMLDRLHDSFQRLSQFSADLAHDLRTPINNLMVQTQVALSQSRTSDDYQVLLASNIEEYERLARMVENMLFLARADHAKIALTKQCLDSQDELQRIADYFEGVAADADVQIIVKASGTITADPILFRRAVNNLVANAIRHTPKGDSIHLAAYATAKDAEVSVTNPGQGILPEHLPRLFDRFYRADQSRSNSASSAGLGLAIVRSIMVLHGGCAEAHSTQDGITTFRLSFPQIQG